VSNKDKFTYDRPPLKPKPTTPPPQARSAERAYRVGSVGRVSGSERVGAEHIIVEQTSSKFRKVHKIQPTTTTFFCCSGSGRSVLGELRPLYMSTLRQPTTTPLPPSLQPH
jgi:hypothetical protein